MRENLLEWGLELPGTKHLMAYRCRYELWGKERTLLVVFSPSLYRKQRASMNVQQKKAEQHLQELAEAIQKWRHSGRGPGYSEASVQKKIQQWTARDHLREFLKVELKIEGGKVLELSWQGERKTKQQVQRCHLGKTVLFTDHEDWEALAIISAYRKLWKSEHLFRISKGREGPWWPMFHWTDSKIRVHALYCYFALLLLSIVQMKLREAGISLNINRSIDRLKKIQETLVIYTNGAAERVLSEMDDGQRQLTEALGLIKLAQQMGNTVLDQD